MDMVYHQPCTIIYLNQSNLLVLNIPICNDFPNKWRIKAYMYKHRHTYIYNTLSQKKKSTNSSKNNVSILRKQLPTRYNSNKQQ